MVEGYWFVISFFFSFYITVYILYGTLCSLSCLKNQILNLEWWRDIGLLYLLFLYLYVYPLWYSMLPFLSEESDFRSRMVYRKFDCPSFMVPYFIKWVTTSWTDGIRKSKSWPIVYSSILYKIAQEFLDISSVQEVVTYFL